ncbi:hypothetical protein [Flavobacterium pedocola]
MINLNSNGFLTNLLAAKGIESWEEFLGFIKVIPYGRNRNRNDFSLVITEKKGTCSSKHALAASVAIENKIPNVALILGMYKMNESNTPIGTLLSDNNILYIPEAHCYLKIDGKHVDLTTNVSDFDKIRQDILNEIIIQPEQVGDFKVDYHKEYLKNWLTESNIKLTLEELWELRETCIEALSKNN